MSARRVNAAGLPRFRSSKERMDRFPDSRQSSSTPYPMGILGPPGQLPPEGDWRVWLLLAGRGFGKTRTAQN